MPGYRVCRIVQRAARVGKAKIRYCGLEGAARGGLGNFLRRGCSSFIARHCNVWRRRCPPTSRDEGKRYFWSQRMAYVTELRPFAQGQGQTPIIRPLHRLSFV